MAQKSGTQSGYEWAVDKGLTKQSDVDQYSGPSESFRNGMQLRIDELKKKEASQNATSTNQ
jgi:hypothetical protein